MKKRPLTEKVPYRALHSSRIFFPNKAIADPADGNVWYQQDGAPPHDTYLELFGERISKE